MLCKNCGEPIRGLKESPDIPVHTLTHTRRCASQGKKAEWRWEDMDAIPLDLSRLAVFVDGVYVQWLKVDSLSLGRITLTMKINIFLQEILKELKGSRLEVRAGTTGPAGTFTTVIQAIDPAYLEHYSVFSTKKQTIVTINMVEMMVEYWE